MVSRQSVERKHTVNARETILQTTRAARRPAVPLPDVRAASSTFRPAGVDIAAQFVAAARAASVVVLEMGRAEIAHAVSTLAGSTTRVMSAIPSVETTVPTASTPRAMSSLDLFVCEAALGVAENGAVWLPLSRLGSRAAVLLAEHIVIAVDRATLVADMHAAYERIDAASEVFGVFIAGPSKTADIEQSLVIGAHGPKRMAMLLLDAT
jgi:L-lactate dehydrogenase complex protein LldG